jgi:hypothetical protein
MIERVTQRRFQIGWLAFLLLKAGQGTAATTPVILFADDLQGEFEEIPAYAAQPAAAWVGLYEDTSGAKLRTARVSAVRGAGSGPFRVDADPPDALILIAAVPALVPGAAVTVARNLSLGPESRQVVLMLGSQQAVVSWKSAVGDGCDAEITFSIAGRTQTLFRMDPASPIACDEPHFSIDWAGDLDRDGRLDLIATFSRKYSMHPRRLLLSSAAAPGTLVAEIALYTHLAQ